MTGERISRVAAVCAASLAAVGVLFSAGELEVTLLMVTAVIAGLVCFDACMNRRVDAFGPWLLLSLAPILKTVPDVWFELRSGTGVLFERYDHAGTLLFGACVFGAVALVSRPSPTLGRSVAGFDAAVILGSATVGGLSGASVAFLLDTGFGSPTAGRLFETPTWFVLAGILAAVVVAASHTPQMPFALSGVLAASTVTSALLAVSVAGRDIDRGWWALIFAALAASAVADRGVLGSTTDRTRRSNAPVVVTLIVGLVAAASAIAARSDRTAWAPGWALLGLMSLAMFALAMASKPLEEQGQTPKASGPLDIGFDDDRRARRARARALTTLDLGIGDAQLPAVPTGDSAPAAASAPLAASNLPPVAVPAPAEPVSRDHVPAAQVAESPTPDPENPDSGTVARIQPESAQVGSAAPAGLSDASLVASAKAAAAVRNAPAAQRHSLAPLAQAHHFDPSTGLLSAAGLQHALARAFDVPRRAGHVTMLMFTIRDLDQIEKEHGRLASAAVTREVADRVSALLPNGDGARFARAAYAVIFVGDRSNTHETTQWLARVLLQLRAPVEGGSLGDKIDVVAGMAQCYESEDAASFVKRANSGLARAVQLVEPTLVAMP